MQFVFYGNELFTEHLSEPGTVFLKTLTVAFGS